MLHNHCVGGLDLWYWWQIKHVCWNSLALCPICFDGHLVTPSAIVILLCPTHAVCLHHSTSREIYAIPWWLSLPCLWLLGSQASCHLQLPNQISNHHCVIVYPISVSPQYSSQSVLWLVWTMGSLLTNSLQDQECPAYLCCGCWSHGQEETNPLH